MILVVQFCTKWFDQVMIYRSWQKVLIASFEKKRTGPCDCSENQQKFIFKLAYPFTIYFCRFYCVGFQSIYSLRQSPKYFWLAELPRGKMTQTYRKGISKETSIFVDFRTNYKIRCAFFNTGQSKPFDKTGTLQSPLQVCILFVRTST